MNQIESGNEADPLKKAAQIDELAKKLRNSECVHSFSSKTQDNRIQFWVLRISKHGKLNIRLLTFKSQKICFENIVEHFTNRPSMFFIRNLIETKFTVLN